MCVSIAGRLGGSLAALAFAGCCLGTANLERDASGDFVIAQTDGAGITGIVVTLHPYPTTLWHVKGNLEPPGDGRELRTPLKLGVGPAEMKAAGPATLDIGEGEEIVVSFEGVGPRGYGYYTATNTPKRYRQEKGRLVEIPFVQEQFEEPRFSSREERVRALREIEEEIAGGSSAFLRIARDPDATPHQKLAVDQLLDLAGTRDLVEAYRDLRTRKTLLLYGYGADDTKICDLRPLADLMNLRRPGIPRQRRTSTTSSVGMSTLWICASSPKAATRLFRLSATFRSNPE